MRACVLRATCGSRSFFSERWGPNAPTYAKEAAVGVSWVLLPSARTVFVRESLGLRSDYTDRIPDFPSSFGAQFMCCSWFSGDLWSLLSFTLIGYWCRQRQVLRCQLSPPGRNWWWVLWSNIQASKWRHLCWVILCGSYCVIGWLMEPFFGEIDSVFCDKILQGLYSSLTIAACRQ